MATISLLLIAAAGYLFMGIILFPSLTQAHSYELIYMIDSTTKMRGSIVLQCRDAMTAEALEVNQIKFWLNRTTSCDLDLTARADVRVIRADATSIKFNLTHDLDGNYTCGRLNVTRDNKVIVKESIPKTLICKLDPKLKINPRINKKNLVDHPE